MSEAAAPRQLLSRPERQASILQGAARAFAAGGFSATSMEDVAAASGITKLIVYRHFDSKDALYRAVLDSVVARLADEFVVRLRAPQRRGASAKALLTVAREDPDGFVLLWRHAAREPEFADIAVAARLGAAQAATGLIGDTIADATVRTWAAETLVAYLVEGTLTWLEHGDPAEDDAHVERLTAGLLALYGTWAG